MGKKKGGGGGGAPPPPPKGGTPKTDNDVDEIGDPELGGLYEDELDITIATISFLAERPELFMSKPFRELRAALDPLVQLQLKKYDVPDYGLKVTAALKAAKWGDALTAMQGVRGHQQQQKQGTLQRWVRDCGFCEDEGLRMRLLDMVVRCGKASGDEDGSGGGGNIHDPRQALTAAAGAAGRVIFPDQADLPEGSALEGGLVDGAAEIKAPSLYTGCRITHHPTFMPPPCARPPLPALAALAEPLKTTLVLHEKGPDRQPPNLYDLKMHFIASPSPWVRLSPHDDVAPHVARHDVPGVPGAFVLVGALTADECQQIIDTAESEAMGFNPHHPVGRQESTGIDECEWFANDDLVGPIFDRIASLLPPSIAGGRVAGVNPRWRLFRYATGAVYRPHIDGSWPGGGVGKNGVYTTDDWKRSRLTFLAYLNEGFEGGCTTFYLPCPGREGDVDARAVVPRSGNILCFPQGNTASLVHEGSAVSNGVKYVIRSDVLYSMPEAKPGGR